MALDEKKILIIDTDEDDRNKLSSYLAHLNYKTESGKCLTDAVAKITMGNFTCLLLDVDLPEMKGYEAVSILKSIAPDIKIIMTTKRNTKYLEAKVREQDIFFYFIKSFGEEELKLAINNVFGQ